MITPTNGNFFACFEIAHDYARAGENAADRAFVKEAKTPYQGNAALAQLHTARVLGAMNEGLYHIYSNTNETLAGISSDLKGLAQDVAEIKKMTT